MGHGVEDVYEGYVLNGEKRSLIKVLIRAIKTVGLEVKKDKFCLSNKYR